MTLTGTDNYGNVLQNYAVQEVLSELSVDAETIRNVTQVGHYAPESKGVRKFTPSYIATYLRNQLNYRYHIKNTGDGLIRTICFCKAHSKEVDCAYKMRDAAFHDFVDHYIHFSPLTLDINVSWTSEQTKKYDLYVSGSDQVWNPFYPTTSLINFLQFAPAEKRVALSPSFGVGTIPEFFRADYKSWLEEIPYLSVREQRGAEIIRELTGREAIVLCDPTLALPAEKWKSIEKKPADFFEEDYMLTYFLGDRSNVYDAFIDRVVERYHLKKIHLFDVMDLAHYATSPQEFIYLVNHAKLVCTDSFHGVAFSILMHTDFVAFTRIENGAAMGSRLDTLLSLFGMEQRRFEQIDMHALFQTDFSRTDAQLNEKREEMLSFLRSALRADHTTEPVYVTTVYGGRKANCCGCGACATACPKQCIHMEPDREGFVYPVIEETQCIHCDRCFQVCPIKNETLREGLTPTCYVGWSKDRAVQSGSSSGGIFTHLALSVIKGGGVVYGAAFDENFKVAHQAAESEQELLSFRGSKYVQSNIGDVYRETKVHLDNGRRVLFSGTPCQINGLYSYLGGDHKNLITQDVVCHGVPSPEVWAQYVDKNGGECLKSISFRDKTYGWHYFSMRMDCGGSSKCTRLDEDLYLRLFLDNTILRPSCHDCLPKKEGFFADITLADCWNAASMSVDIKDDDKGISLIFANTAKGYALLDAVRNELHLKQIDAEKALLSQSVTRKSTMPNTRRYAFFDGLEKRGLDVVLQSWYKHDAYKHMRRTMIYYKTKLKFFLDGIVKGRT